MMRRLAIVTGIFLGFAARLAVGQSSTWTSDQSHSEVDFAIGHMSISKVHGRFGGVAATIQYNEADITKSSVQVSVDVGTVDTGSQVRDTDIKGAKYFDVADFPKARFTSTSVAKNGNGITVTGNFTLHGVTKPVVLDVEELSAPVTDNRSRVHRGFSATATINRTDFGIGSGVPTAMLGNEVKLTIEVDSVKQ